MSIFSSAKTNWRRPLEQRPPFDQLARIIGRKNAVAFLDLVYDTLRGDGNLQVANAEIIDDVLGKEINRVNNKRAYVDALLQRARQRQLMPELQPRIRPEQEYYREALLSGRPPGGKAWSAIEDPAPVGKALARKKAAFWICQPSREELKLGELQKVRTILKKYIPDADSHGVLGPCLGPSSEVIRKIHKTVCPGVAPHRVNILQEVSYPSTVGGGYLLDYIFQQTAGLRWPPFRDNHWVDAAVFFLGAIGAIQCFADGNKRVARIAYAIVLIKGGFVFKAPTAQYERELYNMG